MFHVCSLVKHVRTVERRHTEASGLVDWIPAVLPASHLAEPADGLRGGGRRGESLDSAGLLQCERLPITDFGLRMVSRADGFAAPGATPAKPEEANGSNRGLLGCWVSSAGTVRHSRRKLEGWAQMGTKDGLRAS